MISNAAQRRKLHALRFRWLGRLRLGRMAFQLDQDGIKPGVAGVFRQVGNSRGVLRHACLQVKVFLFPAGKSESPLGLGEGHNNRGWMAVHDRLLVRAVVYLQNAYLGVFAHYRVMLGVSLDRVLGRDDWGETEAQRHSIKRYSHSHVASLGLWDLLQTCPTLIRQGF